MKKINNIIVALLLAFSTMFVSCNRDELISESELIEEQGSATFSFLLNQTRAEDLGAELLENSVLKIYKSNGDLIRRYSPATTAPEELYLIAGNYSVSLSAGETHYATTNTSECVYFGETDFEIEAGQSRDVALKCSMTNTAVRIVYDSSVEANFKDGFITYVSARDSFSKSEAESDSESTLSFTESGDGYFILPEGVSNLSWGFFGSHNDDEVGDLSSTGVIESPKPKTIYTLTLKYSKTPDGYLDLEVLVDESAEEVDDDYVFSPQPTVSSLDYVASVPQNYGGESFTYEVNSMNELKSVVVQAVDDNGDVIVELTPYEDFNVVDLSAQGATFVENSELSGKLTLSKALFDNFTTAGMKRVNIYAIDAKAAKGELISKFRFGGLLQNPNVDLWLNSGVLKACVASNDTHNVVISYREQGSATWVNFDAQLGEDGLYSAEVVPAWTKSTSKGGSDIFSLESGFTAGNTYECKYSVDGVEKEGITFTTGGVQTIPYANMEDSALTCWGQSNGSSTNWASGNNTFAKSLCTQGTYAGMGGAKCAALSGAGVMLVDIAAGNLFMGQFSRPNTSTGKVAFGQSFDWQSRPTKFKFKYAATIGTVDASYHKGAPIGKGDKDLARVFFAIVDWGSRHEVKSGTSAPTGMWDPETMSSVGEGNIIGYASQYITESTSGDMKTSELDVYYYDKSTKPSKDITIVVSCATSAYGDYLTGSTESKLWVDDFELCY